MTPTGPVTRPGGRQVMIRSSPLVCMPMGRNQRDNTVRVLRLGAGVRVHKTARPRHIAAAVRRVLDQPSYAQAANRFAATLAHEAATRPTAIDEAETLLTLGGSQRSQREH